MAVALCMFSVNVGWQISVKNFIQQRQQHHTTTTTRERTVDSVYNNFGVDSLGKFTLKQEINFRHIPTVQCVSALSAIYIYVCLQFNRTASRDFHLFLFFRQKTQSISCVMPSRQFKYVFEIAQLSDSKLNSRCAGWGSLKEKKTRAQNSGIFSV